MSDQQVINALIQFRDTEKLDSRIVYYLESMGYLKADVRRPVQGEAGTWLGYSLTAKATELLGKS